MVVIATEIGYGAVIMTAASVRLDLVMPLVWMGHGPEGKEEEKLKV